MIVKDKTPQPPKSGQQMTRWDYRSRVMAADADLLQFGEEGWELVSVVPIPHDPGQAVFHFKRRRY